MACKMKKRPLYFENIDFQSPRSEDEKPDEKPDCPSPPRQLLLPEMLPPSYDVLRDENEIKEDRPPKSCPCFRDDRDPDGRLRHLAGLVLH